MQYRKDRYGEEISVLGYGCMRFTKKGGSIDLDKAEQEILRAVEAGVNYFDTAYIYPGSEKALGQILEKNGLRSRVKIATKLPQYLISKAGAVDRYFEEQLERLKTDYVDYYLMHMLTDVASWKKLCSMGIEDWIRRQKEAGKIRNIGFSFHGNTEMFLEILNAYDWDFCQIQYNYMDEFSQAGRRGLETAAERGIPVIIMEPLRGGKLVNMLPKEAEALIQEKGAGRSAAEIALRWLWDQPGVTCVLSGMNSFEMVDENCRIASEAEAGMMSDTDHAFVQQLKQAIQSGVKIGCTECRYCMPCPRGVDIPGVFRCYNRMWTESKIAGRQEYTQTIAMRKQPGLPSQCVACGKCESHCPQHLPIIRLLKEAERKLTPLPYRVGLAVARRFLMRGTE